VTNGTHPRAPIGNGILNDHSTLTVSNCTITANFSTGFLTATGEPANTPPQLGPLQNNGGPTFTLAPLCNSPAIDRGTNFTGAAIAVDAAHAIHSDLARGFIRAEVMKCNELIAAGDNGHKAEAHRKETGNLYLKGKDYIVEDGDIAHIRHSG
jgi:hypothetical protein